jgi:hypothetical protein
MSGIVEGSMCGGASSKVVVPHFKEMFTGTLSIEHHTESCTSKLTIECRANCGEDVMYGLRDELAGVASWIECSCDLDLSDDGGTI